jgi:cell division transport system ATP-binding protein
VKLFGRILAVLRLDQVSLRFGRGTEILSDIDFELAAGDFKFLTGPSGAGKSSLLKIMSMTLDPTSGSCTVFGENTALLSRRERPGLRRRIGLVYQDFKLLEHLSVFDNVALPLRITGQSVSSYAGDVMDLLDWVGLKSRIDALPPSLSGGEKQRVAIARAVISKPELILADEPTGSVDPVHAKRLLRLLAELNKQGTTVLVATHDETLLKQVPAHVVHLSEGQLRQR